GVSLSRSTSAAHSASPRQNQRTSLTIGPRLNAERSTVRQAGEEAGSDGFDRMEEAGSSNGIRPQNRTGRLPNCRGQIGRRLGRQFGKNSTKNAIRVRYGTLFHL